MSDLVFCSLESWNEVWRRNQHFVAGLLTTDPELRVLFVEPAADPLYALAGRRRPTLGRGLRALALPGAAGRVWTYQPTKWLPRRLDRGVDRRWAAAIVRAARRVGFTAPLLWINDPSGARVLETTGWPAIYDITDDWLEAERTDAEHARLVHDEGVLMRRCAEVIVCSTGLVATKGPLRPVVLVPNAVDAAFYRTPQPRPGDLPPGPVALYLGTVHTDRIDLDLCVATAEALRGRGTLVFVGPALLAAGDVARLETAGALLLGPRHRDAVPGYLQHADVLVVPHVVNAFTDSLDPIKRYEYAAVGRPVVSTPVAGFADADDPRVTSAAGDAFVDAVRRSLPAADVFPHGADADVPTWADRVRQVAEVIGRVPRSATLR